MASVDLDRLPDYVVVASLGVIALLTSARVITYEPPPWDWIALLAVGTAVVFGPIRWVVRDRIPNERRERLSVVGSVFVLLCVPILLGLGLIAGGLLWVVDVVVLGSLVGFTAASLVGRLAVTEQRRGTSR